MRRFLLLLAVVLLALAAFAPAAMAWYAPAEHTAYIDFWFDPTSWYEWDADAPDGLIEHNEPIPADWPVVVATTWLDSRRGAAIAPLFILHTMTVQNTDGSWTFAVPTANKGTRYWSPIYEWDPVTMPGFWGRDWWVPLGTLPPGRYTGAVHEWAPEDFPTWVDEEWNLLDDPILYPAYDLTLPFSFRVK
jgi:hypothetical protein